MSECGFISDVGLYWRGRIALLAIIFAFMLVLLGMRMKTVLNQSQSNGEKLDRIEKRLKNWEAGAAASQEITPELPGFTPHSEVMGHK